MSEHIDPAGIEALILAARQALLEAAKKAADRSAELSENRPLAAAALLDAASKAVKVAIGPTDPPEKT